MVEMDILADVEEDDQHTVEPHVGQPLAEGNDAVGVVAFQVRLERLKSPLRFHILL